MIIVLQATIYHRKAVQNAHLHVKHANRKHLAQLAYQVIRFQVEHASLFALQTAKIARVIRFVLNVSLVIS